MNLWRRFKYLVPRYRRDEERDMQEELNSLKAMAGPLELGNLTAAAENAREVWTWTWLEQLFQDIRYALRTLRRNPGFAAVVIGTLALGIGMNTAVFSIVNAVLLRPLSYPDADRLLWMTKYRERFNEELVPHPEFTGWRDQAGAFDRLAAYSVRDDPIATHDAVIQGRIATVSDDFWALSGARPALGRLPQAGERNVLVLSHELFERFFHSDRSIVGKPVFVREDRLPVTVTGVLPADFRFEFPLSAFDGPLDFQGIDAYLPEILSRRGYATGVVGKLKTNIAPDRVQAELQAISDRVDYARPYDRESDLRLMPLLEKRIGKARLALWVLLAAVVFVLLIACANIANLLLARTSARQREIAIRASVGAGRARVIRQMLVESTVLVLLGSAAGLVLARWGLDIMVRLGPQAIPRLSETTIDGRVFAFALGISMATAILFGFAPALSLWKVKLNDVLKDGSRTGSASPSGLRGRRLLVAAELALAVVLLTGAGLLLKSFWLMNAHPPGFVPERILVVKFSLSGPQYFRFPERPRAYIDDLLRQLRLVPGVRAASLLKQSGGETTWEGAAPLPAGENPPPIRVSVVSSGYASVLGLQVIRGRWLTDSETEQAIVINEGLARRDFPGDNPLGKRTAWGGVVVGVVADLKYSRLDETPSPEIYASYTLSPRLDGVGALLVRTTGDPLALAPAVSKFAYDLDKTQPVFDIMTLEHALADSIAPRRFNLFVLGTFAAVGLLLALLGTYGLIAYSVARRTHEIGIRMALGAERREVVRMVVRQGMEMALAGILIGLAASLALTRAMATLLYDVEPTDPLTFAAVALALGTTALAACWLPALKAALVDPMIALRYE